MRGKSSIDECLMAVRTYSHREKLLKLVHAKSFTVLLALIFVLGYLSIRRMDEVSTQGQELQLQHSARLSMLLNLRLALTKLDNEARLRQQTESRGELKPPFDMRLNTARDEINELLQQIERPPLSEDPSWSQFRRDLEAYADVTEDVRRYSLEA